MHGAPLTTVLLGLTGLLLLASASAWMKLAKDRERPDESPAIPVRSFRHAAALTGAAFVMLGLSLCWLAATALSSI